MNRSLRCAWRGLGSWRALALLLACAAGSSCSFLANEFVQLDTAGPVAAPATPPSALRDRS